MQVAPQPSAFIFTSAHNALARSAHIIGELDSADSGRRKGGDGRQELLFIRSDPLLRPSGGAHEWADALLLVSKRYRLPRGGGLMGGSAPHRHWFRLFGGGRRPDGDVGNLEQVG